MKKRVVYVCAILIVLFGASIFFLNTKPDQKEINKMATNKVED